VQLAPYEGVKDDVADERDATEKSHVWWNSEIDQGLTRSSAKNSEKSKKRALTLADPTADGESVFSLSHIWWNREIDRDSSMKNPKRSKKSGAIQKGKKNSKKSKKRALGAWADRNTEGKAGFNLSTETSTSQKQKVRVLARNHQKNQIDELRG
jgi:hypothetical protein